MSDNLVTIPKKFAFNWMEFSGSLGDLGLFLPLVLGMAITTNLDIGIIFILAGLMNILTGLMFHQPIPVQPMKAIAAVAITEEIVQGEIAAAGILMGLLIIIIAFFVNDFNRLIPKPIIRGIQLGVGIKLAAKGASLIWELPFWGWNSIFVAIVIACFLLLILQKKVPGLLFVFIIGFVIMFIDNHVSMPERFFGWPEFNVIWPALIDWHHGFFRLTLPQLPLTTLNSVIAVCALSADYFPGRGIAPKRMALSVGMMNLVSVPLGGIPMCHGSGGLAAQYHFGARTGGSVIMLGVMKIVTGLLFGHALIVLLKSYPYAILGTMLVFAGIELAKAAKDSISNNSNLIVILVMASFILGINTLVGFLVGCGLMVLLYLHHRLQKLHS